MPVGWSSSSSSSDEELRMRLMANLRERRVCGRAGPSAPSRFVMYNGDSIVVKCGTVFCPLRKRYFHLQAVKRNPAAYFGDGTLRRYERSSLSLDSIYLIDASKERNINNQSRRVNLLQSVDIGFYIYDSQSMSCNSSCVKNSSSKVCTDFRYERVTRPENFMRSVSSPEVLRTQSCSWVPVPYQIHPSCSVESYAPGRFAFFERGTQHCLSMVENDTVTHHQIDSIDSGGSAVGFYVRGRVVVILQGKFVRCLTWDPDNSFISPKCVFTANLNAVFSCPIFASLPGDAEEACIIFGTGRSIFSVAVPKEDSPLLKKLCAFSVTPLSSLETFSFGRKDNTLLLCGMRNGTIQVLPLCDPNPRGVSGVAPRHDKACVSYVRRIENTFNFVSVGSNGEIKLWDLRYMHVNTPVGQMGCDVAASRYCGSEAVFMDDIACVTSANGHISCLNARKWAHIGRLQRIAGGNRRLHIIESSCGYDLLDADELGTVSHALPVTYSSYGMQTDMPLSKVIYLYRVAASLSPSFHCFQFLSVCVLIRNV
ncbi:hypothetical protein, conserved [Trypanosoma brucei brucei TREU927]|uniref:Uncharacterized protein n=1 Tax=Trypanosoma brucei brucei (strain 927/4 GUTat10.1) TaxID=185431 RepID=Q57U34_TRYB2|nr:hypothetical protein, conserved [Trypanosoma brucei brucei TREU927]AAX70884.1 hypothetical protein, conserved [Trypanosoma brucei]AAZ12085.1 hypothetical protein, conserved [Trypanosoma brucei brucei TREU927]